MTTILSPIVEPVDYEWLITRVGRWLHRTDLDDFISDFITLAEMRLNGDLDARLMDTTVPLVTTQDQNYVDAPTDIINIRTLTVTDVPGYTLEYLSPEQFAHLYSDIPSARPQAYTIVGSQILLGPTPDSAYTLSLMYKARLPALQVAGTNWLLTGYPNAYLFACLCESAKFIADDGRLPVWEQSYQQAVNAINSTDWASGGTMRVRSDVALR